MWLRKQSPSKKSHLNVRSATASLLISLSLSLCAILFRATSLQVEASFLPSGTQPTLLSIQILAVVLQHAAEYFSTPQLTGCLLLLLGFRCSSVRVLELGPAFHIITHSSVPCELRSQESGQNLPTGPFINRAAKRHISRLSRGNIEAVIQVSGVFTVETCGPSVSAL